MHANDERYLTFSVGQLQFIDSFQFVASALDDLVKHLRDEDMKITKAKCAYKKFTSDSFPLLRRKGVYPYE